MAANYWTSTQRQHWLFTKAQLSALRQTLDDAERPLVTQFALPERRHLSLFFKEQITKLGRRLQLRQQAHATANIYVRRYYTRVEMRQTNPYLVMATAVYLAGKMEECPQHIRLVVNEARNMWADFHITDPSKIGECEFSLISELNSQLIVHHPYRTLVDIQSSLGLTKEETSNAWAVINDHYATDLPLLYAPHVIAVVALFLAVVGGSGGGGGGTWTTELTTPQHNTLTAATPSSTASKSQREKLLTWIAQSEIDMEAVVDGMQEMISLYEVWEQYNERVCREQIYRFVHARGLDK